MAQQQLYLNYIVLYCIKYQRVDVVKWGSSFKRNDLFCSFAFPRISNQPLVSAPKNSFDSKLLLCAKTNRSWLPSLHLKATKGFLKLISTPSPSPPPSHCIQDQKSHLSNRHQNSKRLSSLSASSQRTRVSLVAAS